MTAPRLPSPLYVILDRGAARGWDLLDLLDRVLAAGARLVQLREKSLPPVECYPLALALRQRCRAAGATFVVNDRVDLALAVEADGVHLGQDDLPARAARGILRPGMLLGVSAHDRAQARRAVDDGADYVAVGSVYPTGTKAGFQLVGPDRVAELRPDVPVPLVGIGGITADNAGEVVRAGADAVAVISAICAAPDPAAATRTLLERLQAALASLTERQKPL